MGLIDKSSVAMEEEVGVGLAFEASDTASNLVELSESKTVGAFNDEGVAVRDVDSGFDNGGTDEYVVFACNKSGHDFF